MQTVLPMESFIKNQTEALTPFLQVAQDGILTSTGQRMAILFLILPFLLISRKTGLYLSLAGSIIHSKTNIYLQELYGGMDHHGLPETTGGDCFLPELLHGE